MALNRFMHDATTPGNIPANAAMVAGYIDGLYAWSAADWARFPHAVKVRIACFASTNDGDVLDVEWGNATPEQAPAWIAMRRKATGLEKSVYCSYGNLGQTWATVINQFHGQGVAEPQWWVAAYPGIGVALYPGTVAHQFQGGLTAPVDLSYVAGHWPGIDPTPPVPPVPPVSRKAALDMFITYTKTQHWIVVGGHPHVIATQADEINYKAYVPVIPLSVAELAAYGIK
jgi:hypothetical protein